jgi:hypothetical protein
MKRRILLVALLAGMVSFSYAQTYYYQCYECVDKNGAKSKESGGAYITFVNGKKNCSVSDENGYSKSRASASMAESRLMPIKPNFSISYRYEKTQDGLYVYSDQEIINMMGYAMPFAASNFLYFTSDYTKMAYRSTYGSYTYYYKQIDGPYDENIPVF